MDTLSSFDHAPSVVNQETVSEASPDEHDSDQDWSGGSSDQPGGPGITSRLSLLKLGAVLPKFSDFKKQLVREMGFDGMLQFQSWQKINLKYSAYLMDRVDIEQSIINLEAQGMLELSEKQVHSVFAIPIGPQTITSEGVEPSDACVQYTKFAASFSPKGTHSLKAAESVLMQELTPDSRKIDVECFKIAFIIFVVGHVLAPSAKNDYITVDFWAALNDLSKIKEWNWCGYLLKHLFKAVRKFKKDVSNRNPTIHIVGCHLFLQVLVLDSLDLGLSNKPRGVFPRIALFDHESMKKMVDCISVNIGGGEISYHGASVRTGENISKDIVCANTDGDCPRVSRMSSSTKRVHIPAAPTMRTSYSKCGPQEFANHLREKHPTMSGEKLGILLREHNARGLASISELRQSFQNNMFSFADKLMSCLAENCICCKSMGRNQCIMKKGEPNNNIDTTVQNTEENIFETPVGNKIISRLGPSFDLEGSSSANSSIARKRDCGISTSVASGSSKKICVRTEEPLQTASPSAIDIINNSSMSAKENARNEVAHRVHSFFDDLTASIVMYYAEIRPNPQYVCFGATKDTVPSKLQLPECSLGRDPWAIGSVPPPPGPPVLRAIKDWICGASSLTLGRQWVVHPKPRLISLDGTEIAMQLAGSEQLSHEVGATIYRRLDQIDKAFTKDAAGSFWRKFLEPDFATAVLCNADPLTIQSIRSSLTEGIDKFNPSSSRMWHIPAILPDGWAVYSFDMLKRRIYVLDPSVGPFGFSNRSVNMHTYVSNLLHLALFRCLQCLYGTWRCSCGEWTRLFPMLMLEKVDQVDYGICATFLARNFDGDKLQTPLNKENLEMHKNLMLYEVMRLEGNESLVPNDAIEAIKCSFVAL